MQSGENINPSVFLEPGITVYQSNQSSAFALVTFLINDLFFLYDAFKPPVDLAIYKNLNLNKYNTLKMKVLSSQIKSQIVYLNLQESIHLYMLVDLTCKTLVSDLDVQLRELAKKNLELSEEQYGTITRLYLQFAEALINRMNIKFKDNELFVFSLQELKDWEKREK